MTRPAQLAGQHRRPSSADARRQRRWLRLGGAYSARGPPWPLAQALPPAASTGPSRRSDWLQGCRSRRGRGGRGRAGGPGPITRAPEEALGSVCGGGGVSLAIAWGRGTVARGWRACGRDPEAGAVRCDAHRGSGSVGALQAPQCGGTAQGNRRQDEAPGRQPVTVGHAAVTRPGRCLLPPTASRTALGQSGKHTPKPLY